MKSHLCLQVAVYKTGAVVISTVPVLQLEGSIHVTVGNTIYYLWNPALYILMNRLSCIFN